MRTLVAPLHGATARPRAGTHEGVDSANEVVLVTEPAEIGLRVRTIRRRRGLRLDTAAGLACI